MADPLPDRPNALDDGFLASRDGELPDRHGRTPSQQGGAEVPDDEGHRFRHSYAEGCATRTYERLEQMRLEAPAGRMKAEG